jgi:hypothetical protein
MVKIVNIMKKTLKEVEIKLAKAMMGAFPIARVKGFIDWNLAKQIMDTYNMKYQSKEKFFFWFLDKENPEKTIEKNIKPAFEFLKTIKEPNKLEFEIDEILNFLNNPEVEKIDPEVKITPQQKEQIEAKLILFKKQLTNIQDDEQFKETIGKLIKFKSAQGYSFTLSNSLLIWIQMPTATIVNNKQIWKDVYNREIKPNVTPLFVWKPSGQKQNLSKEKKEAITQAFLNTTKKPSVDALSPNEKIKLKTKLRGTMIASSFFMVPVYDVSQTIQIEGKEDFITGAQDAIKDVKWFEEGMIDDSVKPIYKGLLEFCQEHGIKVDFSDDLGGARGVSRNGNITLLANEGNDVGTTKTFAHEISHELLHQTYVKMQGKIDFHVGRQNDGNQTIEQQAEISAWMFMYAFGFDLKTTSLNYTIMWGGNPENMVTVFETVSKMVNHLIDYVNSRISKYNQDIDESMGSPIHGSHITPEEIAKRLGIEKEFNMVKQKEDIKESIRQKFIL